MIVNSFRYHSGGAVLLLYNRADVVELVDTHALGACAARREGSSPFIRTNERTDHSVGFFFWGHEWPEPSRFAMQTQ